MLEMYYPSIYSTKIYPLCPRVASKPAQLAVTPFRCALKTLYERAKGVRNKKLSQDGILEDRHRYGNRKRASSTFHIYEGSGAKRDPSHNKLPTSSTLGVIVVLSFPKRSVTNTHSGHPV